MIPINFPIILSYLTTIAAAFSMGRIVYKPGKTFVETSTTSEYTSQVMFDPYSISHVLHGMIFYYLFGWLGSFDCDTNLMLSFAMECLWEILENSPIIINRYRSNTMSLDYYGDSILNITGDLVAMIFGWIVAFSMPWHVTLLTAVAAEMWMLKKYRDNLFLNVVMLIWPVESIRQWQIRGYAVTNKDSTE